MKTTTREVQKVIFRASRRKTPEVCAVLVGQPGSTSAPLTVWDSQGGHGAGSWGWYYGTRLAKPREYRDELAKLRRQYAPEFSLKVVSRYSRKDREELNGKLFGTYLPYVECTNA